MVKLTNDQVVANHRAFIQTAVERAAKKIKKHNYGKKKIAKIILRELGYSN